MVCGVVAEFNPFHYGHKYQLDKIDADIKIALISPDFVQRGELSILNVKDKAKIALEMGYDIIVQIPTKYAIQNAEVFCTYASRILNELKVDYQVFGAETDNILEIEEMSKVLEKSNILEYTKKGFSYNKACEFVLKDLKKAYKSNNILAMEYIRAIKKFNLNQKPYIIKREKVSYNSDNIEENFSSATNIRNMIKSGENIDSLLPYKNLYKYNYDYENKFFELFKYIISFKDCTKIYDIDIQLFNRIKNNIRKIKSYDEFIDKILSKNISLNRIKRMMLNIVLDIKKEDINLEEKIKELKILALNKKGAKYIKKIDKACVNYKNLEDKEEKFTALYNYLFEEYSFTNVIYNESE